VTPTALPAPQSRLAPQVLEGLLREMLAFDRWAFKGVASGEDHLRAMARDSLDERRSQEQLDLVCRCTGRSLQGADLLEVGAGLGLTVALARLDHGARALGVEAEADVYEGTAALAKRTLDAYGLDEDLVVPAKAEALPFGSARFDLVISSNVMEHVSDPHQMIAESLRVLKPGGYLHCVVPNYGSWWEGHYGIPWIPHLPRGLARAYIRMWGRSPSFLDTLQLVTWGSLQQVALSQASKAKILGWGQELWEERVRSMLFSPWGTLDTVKSILRTLHGLGLIEPLIWLGKRLHWETPLVLTMQKRAIPRTPAETLRHDHG
jgi:SAM-dependent methyltransferase